VTAQAHSALESLAASLHRSILGAMLAMLLLVSLGRGANALVVHRNPLGLLGMVVGLGSVHWIGSLSSTDCASGGQAGQETKSRT